MQSTGQSASNNPPPGGRRLALIKGIVIASSTPCHAFSPHPHVLPRSVLTCSRHASIAITLVPAAAATAVAATH
jgi:hypothetical protein